MHTPLGTLAHDEHTHRRRCLIRQLLRWRAQRGLEWLRNWVKDWPRWPELSDDFDAQWQRGNQGEPDDWR